MLSDLLYPLHLHPLPSLHYLDVWCRDDSDVRALTAFLPYCTNLHILWYAHDSDVSENVVEEMWEAAVRRCRNLEEVRVRGKNSYVSCKKLGSVLGWLSEREGIQALNLRRIVGVNWRAEQEEEEDYTEHFKHLLPATHSYLCYTFM